MERAIQYISNNEYAAAGVWLGSSFLVACLVHVVTTKVLPRLTDKTKTDLDDQILKALGRPLFVTVILVGASFAIAELKPGHALAYATDGILITLGVMVWTSGFRRILLTSISTLAKRMDSFKLVQPRTLPLFDVAIKAVLYGGAAYGIFLAWEVDVTAWLASAGILGLAIGFAAKDTLANLFSGIFILADAPYKLGDFIILGSGERGVVTDIGIRSTRLLTRDDIQIILPNATIANTKIVNETGGRHQKERVRVTVGVAYGSDIDRVREVLLEVAKQSAYLGDEPAPRVRFREFGDSALKFQLMGWIDEPVLQGRSVDELNSMVYRRFAQEGIKISFPQVDVHLKGASDPQPSAST